MATRTVYRGRRIAGRCIVQIVMDGCVIGRLPLRLDIRNHSPTGFEWGYGGSGPAQLALALLASATGRDDERPAVYQELKRRLVAGFAHDGWEISASQLMTEILAIEFAQRQGPQ